VPGRRNWKRRWFTLSVNTTDSAVLFYFENDTNDALLKGRYPLDYRCKVTEYSPPPTTEVDNQKKSKKQNPAAVNGGKYEYHFVVWHPAKHCLQLRTRSREEMTRWMDALAGLIDTLPFYEVDDAEDYKSRSKEEREVSNQA